MIGIKDFKMPKGCGDCACYDVEWARCVFVDKSAKEFDKRLAECPLVADAAPVIHAWWEECLGGLKCSRCGRMSDYHDKYIPDPDEEKEAEPRYIWVSEPRKYCWNCGAKMDFESLITNDRFQEGEEQ